MASGNKLWFVYAIECENSSVYIGQTQDAINRWHQHLSGKGAEWTKKYKPVHLFYIERLCSLKEAMSREKELKTSTGRRMLKKKLLDYLGSHLSAGQAGAGEPVEVLLKRILKEKAKMKKVNTSIKKKRPQNHGS